ncbi:MAG: HPr family phosphocarrier protein [Mobilitalea sp.]
MISKKIVIDIPDGLHLRPVGVLCNNSLEFKSTILIHIGEKTVNAKSLLSVLSAGIKQGDEIEVTCEGPDEEIALAGICQSIENGLGEDLVKK